MSRRASIDPTKHAGSTAGLLHLNDLPFLSCWGHDANTRMWQMGTDPYWSLTDMGSSLISAASSQGLE